MDQMREYYDLPMNEDTALMRLSISRVEEVGAIQGLTGGPIVETVMDKGVTSGEIL